MTCIAEHLSAAFTLDAGEVQTEIVTLRSDSHRKNPPGLSALLLPLEPLKNKGVRTASVTVVFFGLTYLCESAFSSDRLQTLKQPYGTFLA